MHHFLFDFGFFLIVYLVSLENDAAISQVCCVCVLFSLKSCNSLSDSSRFIRGQQSQILHS